MQPDLQPPVVNNKSWLFYRPNLKANDCFVSVSSLFYDGIKIHKQFLLLKTEEQQQ